MRVRVVQPPKHEKPSTATSTPLSDSIKAANSVGQPDRLATLSPIATTVSACSAGTVVDVGVDGETLEGVVVPLVVGVSGAASARAGAPVLVVPHAVRTSDMATEAYASLCLM